MWPLGDTSGTETCVVAAVVFVAVAVGAPTASARSGGRSSSSLWLLKAHEALLITTINRLWGVEGGPGGGWGSSPNRCLPDVQLPGSKTVTFLPKPI